MGKWIINNSYNMAPYKHTVTSLFCCRIVQIKGKLTKQRCDLQSGLLQRLQLINRPPWTVILMVWNYNYNF